MAVGCMLGAGGIVCSKALIDEAILLESLELVFRQRQKSYSLVLSLLVTRPPPK